MIAPLRRVRSSFICALVAVLAGGCGGFAKAGPGAARRHASGSLTDGRIGAATGRGDRYDALTRKIEVNAPDAELGGAYGEFAMIMQAAEYYDAAEPAYLNTQPLQPNDVRWPYYLGHLYKSRGETQKAIQLFSRALELRSKDVAALIWLGRLYLEDGSAGGGRAALYTRTRAGPTPGLPRKDEIYAKVLLSSTPVIARSKTVVTAVLRDLRAERT